MKKPLRSLNCCRDVPYRARVLSVAFTAPPARSTSRFFEILALLSAFLAPDQQAPELAGANSLFMYFPFLYLFLPALLSVYSRPYYFSFLGSLILLRPCVANAYIVYRAALTASKVSHMNMPSAHTENPQKVQTSAPPLTTRAAPESCCSIIYEH